MGSFFYTVVIISRQWSQVGLPFNSVDLDVPFMSSSVVHLAPHAEADGPEDSDDHSKEAGYDHDVGRDDPPRVPVLRLQGHQVGPAAGQHKTHRGHDHMGHGAQLLRHIHGHFHSLVASLSDSPVAFFLLSLSFRWREVPSQVVMTLVPGRRYLGIPVV